MRNLTDVDYKSLDAWLFSYRDVDRQIATRKLEIQDRPNDDENIGGGKSSHISNPTETLVMMYSQDIRLQSLYNFKKAIFETTQKLDRELSEIFQMRWGVGSCNTWEEISVKAHCSTANVYRKRNRILEIFAKEIGYF